MADTFDHDGRGVSARCCQELCDACGGTLTHLGDMPRTPTRPAIQVFRCYTCNAVVCEPWSDIGKRADHRMTVVG